MYFGSKSIMSSLLCDPCCRSAETEVGGEHVEVQRVRLGDLSVELMPGLGVLGLRRLVDHGVGPRVAVVRDVVAAVAGVVGQEIPGWVAQVNQVATGEQDCVEVTRKQAG